MKHQRRIAWSLCALGAALAASPAFATPSALGEEQGFALSLWGVQTQVPRIDAAVAFYTEVLDFEVCGFVGQEDALLELDGLRLWLKRSDAEAGAPEERALAHTQINLRVSELEAVSTRVRTAGGSVGAVEDFPLGRFVQARDPWGNPFELLSVPTAQEQAHAPIGVFNVGIQSTSYESVEPFLDALGFEVLSRAYLPTALPFHEAGASALVAHGGAKGPAPEGRRRNALLLEVRSIDDAVEQLAKRGLRTASAARPSAFGRVASLRSPAGVTLHLLARSPAQLGFERFRSLAGAWSGSSTKGWEARIDFEVVARGSVVIQRSNFAAHPEETMITAYHRDGEELVLTHYCVAGNQPRLRASEFDERGVAFAFQDGTNLDSRDAGHMDSVRFEFPDADSFSSQWSWYQDGADAWMEAIRYERMAR